MTRRGRSIGRPAARPIRPFLTAAHAEARSASHGYVGVEHLLIALTGPDAEQAARLLAEHNITLERTREAVRLVVGSGRGDGPRFDSATLLAILGIDLDEIRRSVEARFGPNAIEHVYASPVGSQLRRRGPLCELGLSPQLKRVAHGVLGRCWDTAPRLLPERLLLESIDSDSAGARAVLEELRAPTPALRAALVAQVQLAS